MLLYSYNKGKQNRTGGNEMKKINIAALTESGCHVYTELKMNEDYTMNQIVEEVKRQRFIAFRILDTMKTYVYI